MLNSENFIKRHGFLLTALGLMLVATLMLAVIQFFAVKRTETETQAALEANLDLQLVAIINEARRDMLERAGYITHSLSHARVRDRDLDGLARAFTRAMRRYPEMKNLYVVFFERGTEAGAWRVFRYEPPDLTNPQVTRYKDVPVGAMIADAEAAVALHQAWLTIPDRAPDQTFSAFAPVAISDRTPQQIFYHPVYEPDHLDRQSDLDRVGLLVFTADAENYPAPDYLKNLAARYEQNETERDAPEITIRLTQPNGEIVNFADSAIAPLRRRGFETQDRLFPTLEFGVAPRKTETFGGELNLTLLLSMSATGLALLGLALTWRAAEREWRVAQMKSDFAANVSHELKTPLTAIRAFGDLLASGRTKKPEKVREYGALITAESNRLNLLLDNILEISKMERGGRRYQFANGDLRQSVEQSVETFQHTSAAKNFEIKIELPNDAVTARFDETAVRQIIKSETKSK